MVAKQAKKEAKAENKADLILHPIRMRILLELMGRQQTPLQLASSLADVPQATLYRQLNKLVQSGLVTVVTERPVRGTIEKVYTVAIQAANLTAEDLANASREDHMHYFMTFIASVLGDFSRYIQQEKEPDFAADYVSYRQAPLYLNDEELSKLAEELKAAIIPLLANQPGPDRKRLTLTTILIPTNTNPVEPEPDPPD